MYEEFGFTDFYKVLGVDRTSSMAEIKNVFRNLARKYHPDKSKLENTTEQFKLILHAYSVLSDPKQRVIHNRDLRRRHFAEHDNNGNRHQKQSQSQSQEQHRPSPAVSKRLLKLLQVLAKYCKIVTYGLFEPLHAVTKYYPSVAKWSLRTLGLLAKWIVTTLAHWFVQFLSGRSIVTNLVIFGFALQILILIHWMGMLQLFGWIIIRLIHIALIIVIFGVKLLMNFLLYMTRL